MACVVTSRQLTIDPAADTILATLPEHTRLCQDVLVSRVRHREFPFSVSSTGRAFNSVTGLKRELRPTLRLGGEPIGGVDIVCAQPALLALEIARHALAQRQGVVAFPGIGVVDVEGAVFSAADGDEVIMRGQLESSDQPTIGFGDCRGVILPALSQ